MKSLKSPLKFPIQDSVENGSEIQYSKMYLSPKEAGLKTT